MPGTTNPNALEATLIVVNLQFLQEGSSKTKAATEAGAKLKTGEIVRGRRFPLKSGPRRAKLTAPLWLICGELRKPRVCLGDASSPWEKRHAA